VIPIANVPQKVIRRIGFKTFEPPVFADTTPNAAKNKIAKAYCMYSIPFKGAT